MKTITIFILLFGGLCTYAQEILTIGEVFNYEIGDEFQTRGGSGPPNADRITIIDKEYSFYKDTVYYSISRNNYISEWVHNPGGQLIYKFHTDTIHVSYTDLDSSIFYRLEDLRYDTLLSHYGTSFRFDSIIENSSNYCGTLINGFNCWLGDFEPSQYTYMYGKGIGKIKELIYFGDCGCETPFFDKSLFYYKKSGIECGIADKTTGIIYNEVNDQVKIYPNPTNHFLNIDFSILNISSCEIRLFDTCGALIMTRKGSDINKIDVSGLTKGFYIININIDNRIFNKKILIQ